jgi:hypothetical protein
VLPISDLEFIGIIVLTLELHGRAGDQDGLDLLHLKPLKRPAYCNFPAMIRRFSKPKTTLWEGLPE